MSLLHSMKSFLSKQNNLLTNLYLLLALLLLPFYVYYIDSNDYLIYITLAEKYAAGNFGEAISDVWSPLLSWGIAIFIKFKVPAVIAMKLVQIASGYGAMVLSCRLIDQKKTDSTAAFILKTGLIFFFLSCAFTVGTPDLLLLALLLYFIYLITDENLHFNIHYPVLKTGIIGGLWFLAKGFGFTGFVFSFSLIHLFYGIKQTAPFAVIIKKYILTMFVFLVVSFCWIIPLSLHNGKFTISRAGTYNLNVIGPQTNPTIYGYIVHPFDLGKIIPPGNSSALNAWEDPMKVTIPAYHPFQSKENFTHYIKVIFKNIKSLLSFHFGKDAGTVLLLCLFMLFATRREVLPSFFSSNATLLILAVSFSFLYVLLLISHRHVWINDLIIVFLFADALNRMKLPGKLLIPAFSFAFSAILVHDPLMELATNFNHHKQLTADVSHLSLHANTASVFDSNPENYTNAALVSYYSGSKYFGMLDVSDMDKAKEELKKYRIDYLLVWGNEKIEAMNQFFIPTQIFQKSELGIFKTH